MGIICFKKKWRQHKNDKPEFLMKFVGRYNDDRLEKLIGPHMKDQINSHSRSKQLHFSVLVIIFRNVLQ